MPGDQTAAVLDAETGVSTADSKRSPACSTTARAALTGTVIHAAALCSRKDAANPTGAAATIPPTSPAQVLLGLMRGASFGPPIAAPGNIGASIGRPHQRQHPQESGKTVVRHARAATPSRGRAGRHRRRPRPARSDCVTPSSLAPRPTSTTPAPTMISAGIMPAEVRQRRRRPARSRSDRSADARQTAATAQPRPLPGHDTRPSRRRARSQTGSAKIGRRRAPPATRISAETTRRAQRARVSARHRTGGRGGGTRGSHPRDRPW